MKPGTRELNSPSRANATNAATAAAVNSPRPRSGMPSPAKRRVGRVRGCTVSGTSGRMMAAAARTARYAAKTSVVGCGAYWANSPATRGPSPRPPMFAAVATSDARRLAEAGISSVSVAVAVPVIRPADSPDTIRAAMSAPTSGARMNTTVLSALAARATAMTGLRPAWSEDRPASSKVVSTAAA
jgi:hypothetical protein